jgi:hypothetical protein
LTFHLSNGCHKIIFAHWLVNCNNYIENVHLIIMISQQKNKILWTSVKISNPILSDCCWNVFHNIAKDLEVFTLVVDHRISVYHKKLNFTNFYNNHKINNENILPLGNFDQSIDGLQ